MSIGLAEYRLPQLLTFDRWFESDLYYSTTGSIDIVEVDGDWQGSVLEVRPVEGLRGRYVGVTIDRLPRDWSDWSAVSFKIAAVSDDLSEATVRIHDVGHDNNYRDRFNRTFDISTAPVRVRIPLGDVRDGPENRVLDLGNVATIVVFVTDRDSGGFLIDDLRLE